MSEARPDIWVMQIGGFFVLLSDAGPSNRA